MKTLFTALIALIMSVSSAVAQAADSSESGLELPRMVSLRSDLINGRSGPDTKYPIEWIYKQKGMPVEIINEFGLWRQIKDWEGSECWVHKSMLTGRRFVKVTNLGENNIYNSDDYGSKVIAKVEDGVVGEVKECKKGNDFCLIKFGTIEGWVPKNILFGIYKDENINT